MSSTTVVAPLAFVIQATDDMFFGRASYNAAMGGPPPQGEQHEERDERAVQARGHWLAQQLGEQWQSDGDGIYRFVARASEDPPASEPLTRESTAAPAPDTVDELIAELSADLRRR